MEQNFQFKVENRNKAEGNAKEFLPAGSQHPHQSEDEVGGKKFAGETTACFSCFPTWTHLGWHWTPSHDTASLTASTCSLRLYDPW